MVIVSFGSAFGSAATTSSMSINSGSMPSWHVGMALIPLDPSKLRMLSDGPVCRSAFNALLPEHVCNEKWKR